MKNVNKCVVTISFQLKEVADLDDNKNRFKNRF